MKLNRDIYQARRSRLLKELEADAVLVLPGATEKLRNRDSEYHFRQCSDFWYLSGFNEPEVVLVLIPGRKEGESVLFCRRRDRDMEIWNGRRAGQEGAQQDFGFDQAFAIDELGEQLPKLLDGRNRVYHTPGHNSDFDQQLWNSLGQLRTRERTGAVAPAEIKDRDQLLHSHRQIKCAREQELMRQAGALSAKGHVRAMRECRPGLMEYQLEAAIHHEFAMHGARHPAYNTIVGGGDNACILHYTENDAELQDGDLVLIDAGCELDHYAGDITRTFPVNGRFTDEQKALYNLVLEAQQAALQEIAPGRPWDAFHKAAVATLVDGLIDLGLLQGNRDQLIKDEAYKAFYMHGTGHWLGLDVHDVGSHKQDGKPVLLQPGMVLTVEPGLYVAPDNQEVEPRWRGIGIRIEDDVLVTQDGSEILTAAVPKTVDEIEQLMAG